MVGGESVEAKDGASQRAEKRETVGDEQVGLVVHVGHRPGCHVDRHQICDAGVAAGEG